MSHLKNTSILPQPSSLYDSPCFEKSIASFMTRSQTLQNGSNPISSVNPSDMSSKGITSYLTGTPPESNLSEISPFMLGKTMSDSDYFLGKTQEQNTLPQPIEMKNMASSVKCTERVMHTEGETHQETCVNENETTNENETNEKEEEKVESKVVMKRTRKRKESMTCT